MVVDPGYTKKFIRMIANNRFNEGIMTIDRENI
jgi:hypothetical protein